MATRREEERLNNSSESQQTFGQRLPHSVSWQKVANKLNFSAGSQMEGEKKSSFFIAS